jgi:RNA polymerase sigma factor for flagellar operon FliA
MIAEIAKKTASELKREQTIEMMLPLVRHVVARMALFLPPHVSKDDLLGAGVVGLIDAVDRFDETKGCSLKTYCALRIRGSILDELRRLDWVPRSIHRDARHLMEVQEILAQKLGREPLEEELREELKMSSEEFHSFLDRVKPASCFSLQEPAFNGDEADPLLHEEVLADPTSIDAANSMLKEEDKEILREQLQQLPLVQAQVLTLYYLEDLRLKEIAEILDLTESRVSQIHTLAINRLRSAFTRRQRR